MQDFTNYNPNPQGGYVSHAISSEAVFFQKIYSWMFFGLALTAGVAYALIQTGAVRFLLSSMVPILVVCGIEFGLVFYLNANIQRISSGTAKMLFLAYAAMTGATFSIVALVYPPMVIFKAFVSTAGVFGAMAFYGLVTKRSLQAWGSFLVMGLIGIIIATVVNWFVQSSAMDWVICVIGVLVFSGLTAYFHQELRVIHATGLNEASDDEVSKVVIMGALKLYLAFINLFLMLLRLFGSSRD
jgi:FtsH-binding integral membrane protein